MASLERIQELVEAPVTVEDPIVSQQPMFEKELGLNHVAFSYLDGSLVIKDFGLVIKKGMTVALVGPSGAGKTTLTDLVARFYDVTEGSITLDGTDIRSFKQEDLRKLIGIVNQESILFNETVRNNIALGRPELTLDEVIAAAKAANAHEFIMEMENGYETEIGERGGKLSGGQKQRLAIARALLKDPEILILDEATSSIDSYAEEMIQKATKIITENRTSIVIAHRLSTVVNADNILYLEEGIVLETGTHDTLMQLDGKYKKLFESQFLEKF
jgi:ABC-type multidrug transport system fused ATPase/permease subunit